MGMRLVGSAEWGRSVREAVPAASNQASQRRDQDLRPKELNMAEQRDERETVGSASLPAQVRRAAAPHRSGTVCPVKAGWSSARQAAVDNAFAALDAASDLITHARMRPSALRLVPGYADESVGQEDDERVGTIRVCFEIVKACVHERRLHTSVEASDLCAVGRLAAVKGLSHGGLQAFRAVCAQIAWHA